MERISKLILGLGKSGMGYSPPADDLLKTAIGDFQKFGEEYDEYFESLISDGSFDLAETTPDRLRYQSTQTLQTYWLSVEQVFLQWQAGYYREKLTAAHQQAEQYLKNLGVDLPGALIYFNKVSNIRYLPFTQIPILGIPHPFSGPEKWSAIPHELGHYVFWNLGGTLRETRRLQQQLQTNAADFLTGQGISAKHQTFVLPWLEEIFSDIVGTRIDRLGFVSSSEDFVNAQAGNENELTLNDGHHPPLVFRPFVWSRALKFLKGDLDSSKRSRVFNRAVPIDFSVLHIRTAAPLVSEKGKVSTVGIIPDESAFETQSVGELLPATEKLVDFLSERLDGLLEYVQPGARKASAFQELKKFIEEEQSTSKELADQKVYELLLKPRILEGGYTHTHGIQTLHGWHESTTHSH